MTVSRSRRKNIPARKPTSAANRGAITNTITHRSELHARAAAVFERIKAQGFAGLERFDTLSMGMTGDLAAAVAAGSTMVRVGRGIFGARTYA